MSGAAVERQATLAQRQRQERGQRLLNILFAAAMFVMTFLAVRHMMLEVSDCDYLTHAERAQELTAGEILPQLLQGKTILWHICVWFLLRTGMSSVCAAGLVTGAVNVWEYALCSWMLNRRMRWADRRLIPAAAMTLCVVMAIYVPWFSANIYVGQDSLNVWHNCTQLMVRPFALLGFWMTADIYGRTRDKGWPSVVYRSGKEAALYALLIVLSVWAKPSFFQALVPGLAILMIVDLIRSRGKAFLTCVKIALAFVPGAILMVLRFISAFYEGAGGGVEFAPLVYWSNTSPCVPVSILLLFAFPILVFAVDWRNIAHSTESQVALTALVSATAVRALLIEGGERRWHGNFTWGYGIAALLVWFVALYRFENLLGDRSLPGKKRKILTYGGGTLLALHLLSGIWYYFVEILFGTTQC